MSSLFRRIAGTLGWTPGQTWTVAVGLLVAVPAALFGLGPTLQTLRHPAQLLAAPPAAAAPAPAPAVLGNATAPAAVSPVPSAGVTAGSSPTGSAASTTAPDLPAPSDGSVFAALQGAGSVRSVAVAADAVVIAADMGADAPGRVVVLDSDGVVVSDVALVINGVPYEQPGGVAVIEDGALVTTTSPASVLRLDPVAGTVTKVADVPDVPLCLPVVQPTDCQAAVPDTPPRPAHLAVSDAGDVYVADRGQACIFRVALGATAAEPWMCDLSFAASPAAGGDGGLAGIAATGDHILVTVASGFDGSDSIQDVRIADGAPADRRQLAAPSAGAGVAGVTVLGDGRVLAALTSANAVFVIAPDGSARTVNVDGLNGPVDVDVLRDSLLVAQQGAIARRPISALS